MSDYAVVGAIGRKRVCFALTGPDGTVQADTIRTYGANASLGVSSAPT